MKTLRFLFTPVLLAHDEEAAPLVVSVKQCEGVVGAVEDGDVALLCFVEITVYTMSRVQGDAF